MKVNATHWVIVKRAGATQQSAKRSVTQPVDTATAHPAHATHAAHVGHTAHRAHTGHSAHPAQRAPGHRRH